MLEQRGLCSPSQGFPFGSDETFLLAPKTCYFKGDTYLLLFFLFILFDLQIRFVSVSCPRSPGYLSLCSCVFMSEGFGVVLQSVIMFYAAAVRPTQKSHRTVKEIMNL